MRKRYLTVGMMMLAAMGCKPSPPETPIGAKTVEDAVEMLKTAYEKRDLKLMATLIDSSTEEGKAELKIMPTRMACLDAFERLDNVLLIRFGADNRDKACPFYIPNPTRIAEVYVDLAKEKKGKWKENRVEIAMGNDEASLSKALVFEKNSSGFWHVCFPKGAIPVTMEKIEEVKTHLRMMRRFCEDMRANLGKYKTPEECADACNKKMQELVAEEINSTSENETAKLVVPKLEAPNVHPLPKDIPANCLTIQVSAKGVPSFDGKELTPAQLTGAVKEYLEKNPGKHDVILKGNLGATYEELRPVMDALYAAGMERINLIGHSD